VRLVQTVRAERRDMNEKETSTPIEAKDKRKESSLVHIPRSTTERKAKSSFLSFFRRRSSIIRLTARARTA